MIQTTQIKPVSKSAFAELETDNKTNFHTSIMNVDFKSFSALNKEIERRQYKQIEGLSCRCSERAYYEMLEALPPVYLKFGWLLSECLTGSLYYHFFEYEDKYYCVVVDINKIKEAQNLSAARKESFKEELNRVIV